MRPGPELLDTKLGPVRAQLPKSPGDGGEPRSGGKRKRASEDVGGKDERTLARTMTGSPRTPERHASDAAQSAPRGDEEAVRLLCERLQSERGLGVGLSSPPLPAEVECAKRIMAHYQTELRRPLSQPAISSSSSSSSDATTADSAGTVADAPLDDTQRALRAAMCSFNQLQPGNARAAASYFSALGDVDVQTGACIWALRAGGVDIPAPALEALGLIRLWQDDGSIEVNDESLDVSAVKDHGEAFTRGVAAAIIASPDPAQCDKFRYLLEALLKFDAGASVHKHFASMALYGWVPILKGLDLPQRHPQALARVLSLALRPDDPEIYADPGQWRLKSEDWPAATYTAAVASVLREAGSDAVYEQLEAHIIRCVQAAFLPRATQAVIALALVCQPKSTQALTEALLARAHALGQAAIRIDPTTRKVAFEPVFGRTLAALLDVTDLEDRFEIRIAGLEIPHRWGQSQLSVPPESDQRAWLIDLVKQTRQRYVEGASGLLSPIPGWRTDCLTDWLCNPTHLGDTHIAKSVAAVYGDADTLTTEVAQVLGSSPDAVQVPQLRQVAVALAELRSGLSSPGSAMARTLAVVLPMNVPARPEAQARSWSERLAEPGTFESVTKAFTVDDTDERRVFIKTLLTHVTEPQGLAERRHKVLPQIAYGTPVEPGDPPPFLDPNYFAVLLEVASSLRPAALATLYEDLSAWGDRFPPSHAGLRRGDLPRTADGRGPRRLMRDIIWTSPRAKLDKMFEACVLASVLAYESVHGSDSIHASLPAGHDTSAAAAGARAFADPAILAELSPDDLLQLLRRWIQVPQMRTQRFANACWSAATSLDGRDVRLYEAVDILAEARLLTLAQLDMVRLRAQGALIGLKPDEDAGDGDTVADIACHVVASYTSVFSTRKASITAITGEQRQAVADALQRDLDRLKADLDASVLFTQHAIWAGISRKVGEVNDWLKTVQEPRPPMPAAAASGAATTLDKDERQ